MNCFDILGISCDSDKKAIKHAYAKLLKKYNPEDDPEGYQRLREAYDSALKYEKSHKPLEERYHNSTFEEDSLDNDNENIDLSVNLNNNLNDYIDDDFSDVSDTDNNINHQTKLNYEEIYNDSSYYNELEKKTASFTNKLNEIYSNIQLRKDRESWKKLLNDDLLWNLETTDSIKGIIITFICSHKFIPKDVMDEIDMTLKISGNEISLYNIYDKNIIDAYINIYSHADTMSYDYLTSINPVDEDKYLYLRLHLFRLLSDSRNNTSLSEITDYYNSAAKLYDKDPELYMIMASYYIKIGYIDTALNMCKKALAIDEYYSKANKTAGEILFNRRDFDNSSSYLEKYSISENNDIESLYMIAHCYYYSKSYKKSLNCFNKLQDKYSRNSYINSYIKNLNKKLNNKLSSNIKFSITKYNANNPLKADKNKSEVKKNTSRRYTVFIMIFVLSFSILNTMMHHNSTRNRNTDTLIKNTKIYTEDGYRNIESLEAFNSASVNSRVSISLSDVEAMDCYKLAAYNKQNIMITLFMKKQDMLDNNYWTHAHGRIYSGKINGKRIFFECSKDLDMEFKKDKKYIIKGYDCSLTSDMYKSLSSFVDKPDDYLSGRYISTTPSIITTSSKY